MRPSARDVLVRWISLVISDLDGKPGYTLLSATLWALPAGVDVEARACFLDVEPLGRLSPGDSL
jgi:hypothetical protein